MPIPDQQIELEFETFALLIRAHGGFESFSRRRLVLPTPEHFPVSLGADHAYAERMFEAVKGHAGMLRWPCRLEMMKRRPKIEDSLRQVRHSGQTADGPSSAIRYFVADDEDVVIYYSETLLHNPEHLIATLAYELSRYLVFNMVADQDETEDAPGEVLQADCTAPVRLTEEEKEEAQQMGEIAAVFLGFGIFRANIAFTYEKFTDGAMHGWRIGRQGALGQAGLAYALGIFMTLLDIPFKRAKDYLTPNPRAELKEALRDIGSRWGREVEGLRRIGSYRL